MIQNFLHMSARQAVFFIGALWACITLPSLGIAPLFDYDETIYAQTALDMMRLGEWIVPTANGIQFFEKPPFTYYLMDICFSIFGENAFAARLPSALFTLFTALLLVRFGQHLDNIPLGISSAVIYLSMLEVGILAHAAILDAVLNFFIAATLLYYVIWQQTQSTRHALITAVMMGAAVSIKGPVGAAIPVLVIILEALWSKQMWHTLRSIPWLTALLVFFIAATPWYLMILAQHGSAFLHEFIWVHNIGRALNPMQGHGGGWHYYLLVFLISTLPWFAFIPQGIRHVFQHTAQQRLLRLGLMWIIVVMVLFTIAQTKLPHYISSIYPAVAILLAMFFLHAKDNPRPSRITHSLLVLTLLPIALFITLFPWIYPYIAEGVAHPRAQAIIAQNITPAWWISLPGIILLLSIAGIWKCQRAALLLRVAIVGIALQSALFFGIAQFAGELLQTPTLHIAQHIRTLPGDMPLYSYKLNAPSVSFYSRRNYKLIDTPQTLQALTPPFAIFMRSEALDELHGWHTTTAQIEQGGYLLYVIDDQNGSNL